MLKICSFWKQFMNEMLTKSGDCHYVELELTDATNLIKI